MKTTTAAVRHRLLSVLTATALGGATAAALMGPSATASPDPCAASSVAKTVGKVVSDTGDYLDSHPETNQAMTSALQDQRGPQALAPLKAYFDANPKARSDIEKLTEPLSGLTAQCQLSISLPQMLGLPGGPGTQAVVGQPGPGAVAVPRPGPAPAAVPPGAVR